MKSLESFSFVPTFPPGTMPISIITVVGHMCGRYPIKQMRGILSKEKSWNRQQIYGFGAREIAQSLYGASITPSEFLRQYTMFGIIERIIGNDALTEDDEHFLIEGMFAPIES